MISLPREIRFLHLPRDVAEALIEAGHQTCPYSKATRGNIHVETNLVQTKVSA